MIDRKEIEKLIAELPEKLAKMSDEELEAFSNSLGLLSSEVKQFKKTFDSELENAFIDKLQFKKKFNGDNEEFVGIAFYNED